MHMHEPKMLVESKGLREDVIDEWSNGSVIKFFIFSFLSSSDQVFLVVFIKCINFRMDVLSIPPSYNNSIAYIKDKEWDGT